MSNRHAADNPRHRRKWQPCSRHVCPVDRSRPVPYVNGQLCTGQESAGTATAGQEIWAGGERSCRPAGRVAGPPVAGNSCATLGPVRCRGLVPIGKHASRATGVHDHVTSPFSRYPATPQ